MLKDIGQFEINRVFNTALNIFEIKEVQPAGFVLEGVEGTIAEGDVLPIPINGQDDRWIYYRPIIAGSMVRHGDPIPVHKTDYTYYFDAFARSTYKDKTFQDIMRENEFKFVHEVQHYLTDEFHHHDLKINFSKIA